MKRLKWRERCVSAVLYFVWRRNVNDTIVTRVFNVGDFQVDYQVGCESRELN